MDCLLASMSGYLFVHRRINVTVQSPDISQIEQVLVQTRTMVNQRFLNVAEQLDASRSNTDGECVELLKVLDSLQDAYIHLMNAKRISNNKLV